jgi:hypothetical protein
VVYSLNEVVVQIGQITIEGNVIPNEWYSHLRNEKGKIQITAALILADIVYWYRPIPIYDIKTGELIGHGKKFKDDLLQLSYKYFTNKFGLSEGQIRNALIFLEEKGLVSREFRNIVIDKHILNNVMYIGIYPEKISEITGKPHNLPTSSINEANAVDQATLQIAENQKIAPSLPRSKYKEKDWAAKFTDEQKVFLDYLLNIKPEIGDSIERDHATWWIKHFGIEKVKVALQVYCQRVEKAKQDPTVPMPQHIGKYIRKALNDGLIPIGPSNIAEDPPPQQALYPYSEKSNQEISKIEPGPQKNETTNTQTSMTSLSLNEVNDNDESVTFQESKETKEIQGRECLEKATKKLSSNPQRIKTNLKKFDKQPDWKELLTSEEQKFLSYLIRLHPEKGDPIEEKHATWWIKHFGIEKIKIALQVYWQQVEKAKKDSKVPMPISIGAYVREALNKGTQPCRENDRKNKAFAEQFKKQMGWSDLTIREKYCRAEDIGKEWHYNLPEAIFEESLKRTFENYCGLTERQSCVA